MVKVSEKGSIPEKNIEKGLKWVIKNREKYDIHIVNMSLGGDMDAPTNKSKINQLAEELVKLGVVVTVAARIKFNSARECAFGHHDWWVF